MILWLWSALALAEPLLLDDVLATVDERVPALAAAQADIIAADGKRRSSAGAFDPVLASKVGGYTGYYARQVTDNELSATSPLGPSVQVGYTRGAGDFPTYDGRVTSGDGELWVGASTPLLEGLGMSAERAKLLDGRLYLEQSESYQEVQRQKVRGKAEASWWYWVAKGASWRIADQQVQLAEQRNVALRVEVEQGQRAPMSLLDNERVLFERLAARTDAERELAVAARKLSLWYRDDAGEPQVPTPDQLPEQLPADWTVPSMDDDLTAADTRPDLQVLRTRVDRATVAIQRGKNLRLPSLDAGVQARRDLGDEPSEVIWGAELKLPLGMRKGIGETQRAEAARTRVNEELRGATDQLRAELGAAHDAWKAAEERVGWAQQAEDRAREVLAMEVRSWELGQSDLFVLLQREDKLAKASKDVVNARLVWALADLDRRTVAGQL